MGRRRLPRILLNAASLGSAILCLATGALWCSRNSYVSIHVRHAHAEYSFESHPYGLSIVTVNRFAVDSPWAVRIERNTVAAYWAVNPDWNFRGLYHVRLEMRGYDGDQQRLQRLGAYTAPHGYACAALAILPAWVA